MQELVEYCPATEDDLERLWAKNIAANPGNPDWPRWRTEFMADNRANRARTFVIRIDGEPVGEGTIIYSPLCRAIRGRERLADNLLVANLNALRIESCYEGQGHISALIRMIEAHALELGYRQLSIGVEPKESRNLGIYLHWGYTNFLFHEQEEGDLVLYYAKNLREHAT